MSNEKRWFVSVGGGAPVGPVTRDQLIRGTQAGKIPIDAIVCEEGGTTWTPLRELPDIRSHAAARDVEAAGSDDGRAWFVRAPGTAETGPVTTDKLLKSIRAGGIPRESEVREDGARTWLPVLNVPELKHAFAGDDRDAKNGSGATGKPRTRRWVLPALAGALLAGVVAVTGLWLLLRSPAIELTDFVDHPADFKGELVTIKRIYLQEDEHLRDLLGRDIRLGINSTGVVAQLPKYLEVPNAARQEPLVVTFRCDDGRVDKGNVIVKVTRP